MTCGAELPPRVFSLVQPTTEFPDDLQHLNRPANFQMEMYEQVQPRSDDPEHVNCDNK